MIEDFFRNRVNARVDSRFPFRMLALRTAWLHLETLWQSWLAHSIRDSRITETLYLPDPDPGLPLSRDTILRGRTAHVSISRFQAS